MNEDNKISGNIKGRREKEMGEFKKKGELVKERFDNFFNEEH